MLEVFGLLFLGLAWLVPNHYPPWNSFYSDSCAAVTLLALLLHARRRFDGIPRAAVVVCAIALIPPLQWLASQLVFTSDAALGYLYVSALGIAIATGYAWSGSGLNEKMAALCWTILASSLLSLVIAGMQAFKLTGLGIWGLDAYDGMRPYANLGQPNNLATLFGLALASVWFLYETGRLGKIACILVAASFVFGLSITQSRTAFLYGPAIVACMALARRRSIRSNTSVAFTGVAVVMHWATAIGWSTLQRMIGEAPVGLVERSVDSVRFLVWPVLLDASVMSPAWGYGWLQVGAAELAAVGRHAPVGELWLHGHNVFLEFVLWCGYPLGLVLSFLVLWWTASRAARLSSIAGIAAFAAVMIFGIHSMTELPHHYAYFLVPIGLLVGFIERDVGARATSGRLLWLPTLASFLLVCGVWRAYPAVEEDFRTMRFDSLGIGPDQSRRVIPDSVLLSSLTEFLAFTNTPLTATRTTAELATMDSVANRYPYPGVLYKMAVADARAGRFEQASYRFSSIRSVFGEARYREMKSRLVLEHAQSDDSLRRWASGLAD